MVNFVIIAILAAVVGIAARYIYSQKKKGAACIGCPHACDCAKKRGGMGCGNG